MMVGSLNATLDEWNSEFVKIKYLRGDYEKRLVDEVKRSDSVGVELAECRTELANLVTTLSVQRREMDRSREEVIEVRADLRHKEVVIRDLTAERRSLDREKDRLRKNIAEKESALARGPSEAAILKAVEDFKASRSCRKMIEDHAQEVRDHILNVEMKERERQSLDEGFTRGFLKAVRLVHRQTGADTSGITESQVSEDESEPENVLKDILFSDDEDLDVGE